MVLSAPDVLTCLISEGRRRITSSPSVRTIASAVSAASAAAGSQSPRSPLYLRGKTASMSPLSRRRFNPALVTNPQSPGSHRSAWISTCLDTIDITDDSTAASTDGVKCSIKIPNISDFTPEAVKAELNSVFGAEAKESVASPKKRRPLVRTERDSLGEVEVPGDRLWGAQTQRSLENFCIGDNERMPVAVIRAMGIIKLAAAQVNQLNNKINEERALAIVKASEEVIMGLHNTDFPLVVWQTGSGTQTNMNANEVIANRANQLLGKPLGSKSPVHPNDHVNMGQSSNDTFPTAMHIASVLTTHERLLPALDVLCRGFEELSARFSHIVKIGRTHMQDATPLTLGQEFGAFAAMLRHARERVVVALEPVLQLAQGGTAVGTGVNTYEGFADTFAQRVAKLTGYPFKSAENKFEALSAVSPMVHLSAALATTAADLLKISNDIRLLSSGPRCGIGELSLPANEPGSSIMPGKVNPTQCEALSMVCAEVMGNHTAVTVASSHGHLQLNVYRPVIIYNILRSIRLLGDGCDSFYRHCVSGIQANERMIASHLSNSLMLVTALAPHVGYDKCAKVALHAHQQGLSLKEAALALKVVTEEEFQRFVQPSAMLKPNSS